MGEFVLTGTGATAQGETLIGSGLYLSALFAQSLIAALAPVLGAGVYPQIAPDGSQPPYAIYQVISTVFSNTMNDGAPAQNDRYQIDIYASTYSAVQRLADAAHYAVLAIPADASGFPAIIPVSHMDQYEADIKLHRVVLEFSVWQSRRLSP